MGWLVLTVLTLIAVVDSLALARRAAPSGRAELGMVTMALLFAILGVPVLVLGYTNQLTVARLGVGASPARARILRLLHRRPGVNVNDIAETLHLPRALLPFGGGWARLYFLILATGTALGAICGRSRDATSFHNFADIVFSACSSPLAARL